MKTVFKLFAFFLLLFLFAGCNSKLETSDLRILSCIWEGRTSDYSIPPKPDSLFPIMKIQILENGQVIGNVGNAVFKNTLAECNRGSLARALNFETDYKIEGFLIGKINSRDTSNVRDRDIAFPFNIENDTLKGTLFLEKPWTYPLPILPKIRLTKKTS